MRKISCLVFAWSLLICTSLQISYPPPAQATQELPTLVVLNLVAEHGIDEGKVRLLNELLLTEFGRRAHYRVMGGSDIEAMLSLEMQKQLTGCTDTECLADIGGALGADFLAISNVGRVGDYYLFNVKIINVRTSEVMERWSEQVKGVEGKLMMALRRSVAAVTKTAPPETEEKGIALAVAEERSSKQLWGFVALGASAVLGGTGVVLLAAKGSEDEIRTNQYRDFLNATNSADAATRYDEVTAAASRHNTMLGVGCAFLALAAATGALAAYELLTMPAEPSASITIGVNDGGGAVFLTGGF